jgi:hypothetical protein
VANGELDGTGRAPTTVRAASAATAAQPLELSTSLSLMVDGGAVRSMQEHADVDGRGLCYLRSFPAQRRPWSSLLHRRLRDDGGRHWLHLPPPRKWCAPPPAAPPHPSSSAPRHRLLYPALGSSAAPRRWLGMACLPVGTRAPPHHGIS